MPLHCLAGYGETRLCCLTIFWYLWTKIVDEKPFGKKNTLYPCQFFFVFAIFLYWKFQRNTKVEMIMWWSSLYPSLDLSITLMATLGSTEHPSTSQVVLKKIPDIIPFICKYLLCVCKRWKLFPPNTLLHLNRNNKKSLKVTKYPVCAYISLTTL